MFLGQQDVRLPAKADIFEYEYIPLQIQPLSYVLVKKGSDVLNTLICRTTCESVVTDDFVWYTRVWHLRFHRNSAVKIGDVLKATFTND